MERNKAVVAYIDGKCYDGKVLRQIKSKGTYLVRVNDLGFKEVKSEDIILASDVDMSQARHDYSEYLDDFYYENPEGTPESEPTPASVVQYSVSYAYDWLTEEEAEKYSPVFLFKRGIQA